MLRFVDIILNAQKTDFLLKNIRTILLVEVQDIGDTIIASPCIRQIRKRFPEASIDMLVQTKSIDMVRYNPNIDNVMGVDNITSYVQLFRTSIEYRKKCYDLVINFSPSVRNNLITALCGAKIISGYINDFYFLPTNHHDQLIEVRGFKPLEETSWYCDEPLIVRALKPAAPFGIDLSDRIDTELFLPEDNRKMSDLFFDKHNIKPKELLAALHPVCLNPFRNWPPEQFAGLGDRLIEHYKDIRIWLLGTDADKETLNAIYACMKHKEKVIYDTSLPLIKTASVIARCNVLVGMDSCPSDISGALGIPTVHMHGPTSADVTGPGGRKNYPITAAGVPCSPCGLNVHICLYDKRCMREITIAQVFDSTVSAIDNHREQF
ncbi:glycosyltransferase family 9 protein [bacterium]|nr:glycosyltransferase family 9 protein [bacterium]